MEAIYLDNAATSFPKPAGVSDRMKYYLDCVGASAFPKSSPDYRRIPVNNPTLNHSK